MKNIMLFIVFICIGQLLTAQSNEERMLQRYPCFSEQITVVKNNFIGRFQEVNCAGTIITIGWPDQFTYWEAALSAVVMDLGPFDQIGPDTYVKMPRAYTCEVDSVLAGIDYSGGIACVRQRYYTGIPCPEGIGLCLIKTSETTTITETGESIVTEETVRPAAPSMDEIRQIVREELQAFAEENGRNIDTLVQKEVNNYLINAKYTINIQQPEDSTGCSVRLRPYIGVDLFRAVGIPNESILKDFQWRPYFGVDLQYCGLYGGGRLYYRNGNNHGATIITPINHCEDPDGGCYDFLDEPGLNRRSIDDNFELGLHVGYRLNFNKKSKSNQKTSLPDYQLLSMDITKVDTLATDSLLQDLASSLQQQIAQQLDQQKEVKPKFTDFTYYAKGEVRSPNILNRSGNSYPDLTGGVVLAIGVESGDERITLEGFIQKPYVHGWLVGVSLRLYAF